jgi:hypothetical protein
VERERRRVREVEAERARVGWVKKVPWSWVGAVLVALLALLFYDTMG